MCWEDGPVALTADGIDLRTLHAIDVRPADKPDDAGERVVLAVVADARYGWRVRLVCPGCGRRWAHLYPTLAGVQGRMAGIVAIVNASRRRPPRGGMAMARAYP